MLVYTERDGRESVAKKYTKIQLILLFVDLCHLFCIVYHKQNLSDENIENMYSVYSVPFEKWLICHEYVWNYSFK